MKQLNDKGAEIMQKYDVNGATDVTDRFRAWMIANHGEQWHWFEQHRDDTSVKPANDELLEIIRKLERETKNGYHLEERELGKRGPAND